MTTPVGGKDYQRTWTEFQGWFFNEKSCADFLEKLRWHDGFICPSCTHQAP
ncbi:MAG: transposase, partial [Deltaproteobacteria bacterium]|nr:transposase [Deltaproteobacteria bacterium]